MHDDLPQIATFLAHYLRDVTGNRNVFARVILPSADPDENPDTAPYIKVGELFLAPEIADEIDSFYIYLRSEFVEIDLHEPNVRVWSLIHVTHHVSRDEGPISADRNIFASHSLSAILERMVKVMIDDRLATAKQCLDEDIRYLSEGVEA